MQALKSLTGSDAFGLNVTFSAGQTLTEPGIVPSKDLTLGWNTFTDAANEAGDTLHNTVHYH